MSNVLTFVCTVEGNTVQRVPGTWNNICIHLKANRISTMYYSPPTPRSYYTVHFFKEKTRNKLQNGITAKQGKLGEDAFGM